MAFVQAKAQLEASKEQASMLKQSLTQTTSTLEDSEKEVNKLSQSLDKAEKQAKSLTARVRSPPCYLYCPGCPPVAAGRGVGHPMGN